MARAIRDVDLCALIKACGEAGIYKFKHGTLEFEFGNVWPQRKHEISGSVAISEELGDNEEVSQQDEDLVRELKQAELLLEDPEAFEKLQFGDEG